MSADNTVNCHCGKPDCVADPLVSCSTCGTTILGSTSTRVIVAAPHRTKAFDLCESCTILPIVIHDLGNGRPPFFAEHERVVRLLIDAGLANRDAEFCAAYPDLADMSEMAGKAAEIADARRAVAAEDVTPSR